MITHLDQIDLSIPYSYADYLTWQFKERVELIKGFVRKMSPAPLMSHQRVSTKLLLEIGLFLKGKPCEVFPAPFDVRLTNKQQSLPDMAIVSVVQPDLSVVCDPEKLDERGCIGAPDWIIEILSPGNSKKEMKDKFSLYEENGVREYWIVDPTHFSVQVFDLIADKFAWRANYVSGDTLPVGIFPGFKIEAAAVFGNQSEKNKQ